MAAIDGILQAAAAGPASLLAEQLDAHPELIDALSGDFQKYSALHCATGRNRHDCLRLLIARGANLELRDFPDNATALHVAAAVGDLDTVRLLVEGGADVVGVGDDYEVGVLGWATCFHAVRAEIVAYLLDRGAPLTLWTAIALDRADGRDTIALHLAVNRRKHDVIAWLIGHGVAIDAKRPMWDCNHTALHMTVENNEIGIARTLLDAGADPNMRDDKYNSTAPDWARFFGRPEFMALFEGKLRPNVPG